MKKRKHLNNKSKAKVFKSRGLNRGLKSDTKIQPPPVESQGDIKTTLSKEQAEILHLVSNEYLTPKQIAIRRQCSISAVYKIISKLKKKGLISPICEQLGRGLKKTDVLFNPFLNPSEKKVTTVTRQIRLHGQEFRVGILYKDQRYKKLREKSNIIYVDGNTIRLYRDSLEIYSGKSFYSDTTYKATVDSMDYFTKIFSRLENDLKIIILKSRYQNIRIVKQHYAEVNNELAQECEKKAEKIRVFAKEDGKLWFTIDNSFNLHEAETQHPDTSPEDMEAVVRPFFNDLRDNRPPTLSELMVALNRSAEIHKESAAALNTIIKLMKPVEIKEENKDIPEYIG